MDTEQIRALLSSIGASGGAPIMDRKKFAEVTGQSVDAVNKAIQRGHLPTVQIGQRRSFVNLIALAQICIEEHTGKKRDTPDLESDIRSINAKLSNILGVLNRSSAKKKR